MDPKLLNIIIKLSDPCWGRETLTPEENRYVRQLLKAMALGRLIVDYIILDKQEEII